MAKVKETETSKGSMRKTKSIYKCIFIRLSNDFSAETL